MKANPDAFEVGRLAERLVHGYFAHAAAITISTDGRAMGLIPPTQPGLTVPVGYVSRNDGTQHSFHFGHFLERVRIDESIKHDLEVVWLTGALLAVGDALSLNKYFDRAPELELLRHLRNGIAHGNKFRIDNPMSLKKFPAHNRFAWIRGNKKEEFIIDANLHGRPILFDFMGPGDVLDLLLSVGVYLIRMGNGDPLRP